MLKRTMLVAAAMTVALALGAATAGAQVYPTPTLFATISDTTPTPGETVTITAGGYVPGTTVTVTLEPEGTVLGTAVADADGNVTLTVTIPADLSLGDHAVAVTGETTAGVVTQAIPITVVSPSAADGGTQVPGTAGGFVPGAVGGADVTVTGGLPRTGSDNSMPLARAAALLVAIGGVMVLTARSRRAAVDTTV
jgi:LPXTG cell wall anchor motif